MSSLVPFFRRTLLIALGALALSTAVPSGSAHADAPEPGADAAPSGVVNINTASAEELERLPGVGPSRASAILELRAKVKTFRQVEDLLRVKGIGRASLRKLRPMISLDGATTLAAKSGRPRAAAAPAKE